MDNHPIPQNVTGFQFKLIGSMTIKQFAYLAGGSIFAFFFFSLPFPFILKFPAALFAFILGFALAFLPIDGRPMDHLLLYFLKALFTPNQYVYQKEGEEEKPLPKDLPNNSQEKEETEEERKELVQETQLLTQELEEAKVHPTSSTHEKVLELEEQLREVLRQRQELERQIQVLNQKLSDRTEPSVDVPTPIGSGPTASSSKTAHVPKAPPFDPGPTGIGTDVPNLIAGVVKDPRGNVLPNILVEVKDKEGNPVRAFKTNGLGQFTSTMPLANGTYTLIFEDPRGAHKFDSLEVTANGEIMSPVEAISTDEREELRRSLFAQSA